MVESGNFRGFLCGHPSGNFTFSKWKEKGFRLPNKLNLILLGLVGLSFLPLIPYPFVPGPTSPKFFTQDVGKIPKNSVVLVAPYTYDGANDLPMYWQTVANFRFQMPEGYVFVPGPVGPQYVLTLLTWDMFKIDQGSAFAPPLGRRER